MFNYFITSMITEFIKNCFVVYYGYRGAKESMLKSIKTQNDP